MSESDEEIVTRRPARERPQREVHRDPDPPVGLIEDTEEISPEDALADSRRQLQESDERVRQERAARQAAERQVAEARAQAATAARTQQTDRQTVITQGIQAAKAEKTAAMAAYRAAREAADFDAETAAMDLMTSASQRIELGERELTWIKDQPQQAPAQQEQGGPSEAARRWIADHPLYNVDDDYKDMALMAHNKALRAGHPDGSQTYINYIDNWLTNKLGDGHGQIGHQPESRENRQVSERQSGGGTAPPSRRASGGGGPANGMKVADLGPLGTVQYQKIQGTSDRRIRMSKEQREMFGEYAKISFPQMYHEDPETTLYKYVNEQIDYATEGPDERLENGRILYGDGGRYQ